VGGGAMLFDLQPKTAYVNDINHELIRVYEVIKKDVESHFNAYHIFEPDCAAVARLTMPAYIQSLDTNNVPSKAIALNCAAASGIIADFLQDDEIMPTVSGRMGSGTFAFSIADARNNERRTIQVNNSQIEIDAAYEGVRGLALFEAKRDLSDDFLIRQLYYPFRAWQGRVTKPVRPLFLVYSNGVYRLYEYAFQDPYDYNSLVLVCQKGYAVEDTVIEITDIQDALRRARTVPEPRVPFPQADSDCILSHKAFSDTLRAYFETGVMPPMGAIVQTMKQSGLFNVGSDSTFERRSATIKGWLNWIVGLID